MRLLYSNPETGMSKILIRIAPAFEVPLHGHTELEQTYMLEERFVDDESECGLGDFVWRPSGNRHIARLRRSVHLVLREVQLLWLERTFLYGIGALPEALKAAAVNIERDAGDIARALGAQKHDCAREFLGLAEAV